LKNPAEVIDKAAAPVFGDPVALDLGGRGIRSIEFVESRYVIVAGPFDNGKRSGKGFALYTWSGKGTDLGQTSQESGLWHNAPGGALRGRRQERDLSAQR
jgi:hypothetical protein